MARIGALITDDSPFFIKLLSDLCISMDIEVLHSFESGETLVASLSKGEFAGEILIFLDINMPGRSGKEVLPELLEYDDEAIVIMSSSLNDAKTVDECLGLGAANYINKDTSPEQMKQVIDKTLKMNGL